MIKTAINKLIGKNDLTKEEMYGCFNEIMSGDATDAQIGAFLTALKIKGEGIDEITAAASVMREKATHISSPEGTIDTCGTGGDMSNSFNVSTTTALILAACGIPVAKHGNRSVSSRSGSADVLEALGIRIDLSPREVERCLAETGFGFLFAPNFHPAMKFAINARREIGISTIFNILGPITNPAQARRQIVGVFAERLTEPIAAALCSLGSEDAMVVHGLDGMDEASISDMTRVSRCRNGAIENIFIKPEDFGLTRASRSEIEGGDRTENAKICIDIFKGAKGARRDIAILNSALGIILSGKTTDPKSAAGIAAEAIDSGAALNKLNDVIKITSQN